MSKDPDYLIRKILEETSMIKLVGIENKVAVGIKGFVLRKGNMGSL